MFSSVFRKVFGLLKDEAYLRTHFEISFEIDEIDEIDLGHHLFKGC